MRTTMMLVLSLVLLLSFAPDAPAARELSEVLMDPGEGTFWYRMVNAETGKPQGYAVLVVSETGQEWYRAEWEMKLSWPGGSYEEQRTLVLDAFGLLRAASYYAGGEMVGDGNRKGRRFVGKAKKGEEVVEVDREIPPDSVSGISILIAAMVAFEDEVVVKRTDLDEANGFTNDGVNSYAYKGSEKVAIDGKEVELHRIEMKRGEKTVTIWVDEERVITKIDWGGAMLSILSEESTKHLYEKPEPAVTQVESGPGKLVLTGDFPKFTPQEVYDHFTKPELLKKWWPQETDVDLKVGGKYHLSWPDAGWFLRGKVVAAEPGKRFSFTWNWDHMKEFPELTVDVALEALEDGGTKITLTHGPYEESEAHQKERAGHLQGWLQVLARLKALR